jgi:selenocysteine lyase/cysteine desulfurase
MPITRRTLLGSSLLAPAPADIRGQFMLRKGLVYMNAANIAPAPAVVWREYQRQLEDFQSDPSFQNREIYKTLAETVRARIARYVRASPEEIAITRNTSEGNNLVAQGLRLNPGDEVLITSHNHPSNTNSWNLRAKQAGASLITAPVPIYARSASELFDSLAARVTSRTRVIALSHFTNTTGLLYPVKELASLARKSNAWLHIDGAQSFGWMDLDLHALGVDSFTGSMHKWPMGPLESGVLYVRQERLEQVTPAILSVDYWSDRPVGARKFELLGQRDDPRLRAMEKTFDFLESIGAAAIEARVRDFAGKLRTALAALSGAKLVGSGEPAISGPVIKIHIRDFQKRYDELWNRHRIAMAKTDSGDAAGLRFSPHIYNTQSDIDAVVAALKSLR